MQTLLNGDISEDSDATHAGSPTRAWWIGAGICLFPVYLLFSALGAPGRGTAAICFGGAMIVLVRLRWDLKNRMWFWASVTLLALLHIALILFVPWPNKNSTLPVILPVGILDALSVSFLIQLVARKMGPADRKGDDLPSKR